MERLTLVTVTANRGRNWEQYVERLKLLYHLYGDKFDTVILDNTAYPDIVKLKECDVSSLPIRFLHLDTFYECRRRMTEFVETPYMAILDDDDILTDSFLSLFEYYQHLYPSAEMMNFNKVKIKSTEYPVGDLQVIVKNRRLELFYDYEKYSEQKYTHFYPINGYNVIKTDFYREVTDVIVPILEDSYPLMKCYLEANLVLKIPVVWQFYQDQNHHLLGRFKQEDVEEAFVIQLKRLLKEYPSGWQRKVVVKQLKNVIKSFGGNPTPKLTLLWENISKIQLQSEFQPG